MLKGVVTRVNVETKLIMVALNDLLKETTDVYD